MVTWAIVEEPHGRFNPRAAERLASRVLADAIEDWLAQIEKYEATGWIEHGS